MLRTGFSNERWVSNERRCFRTRGNGSDDTSHIASSLFIKNYLSNIETLSKLTMKLITMLSAGGIGIH